MTLNIDVERDVWAAGFLLASLVGLSEQRAQDDLESIPPPSGDIGRGGTRQAVLVALGREWGVSSRLSREWARAYSHPIPIIYPPWRATIENY